MEAGSNGTVGAVVVGEAGARAGPEAPAPPAVPPLAISGLVVAKADLVAALRLYVPQIVDVHALDGGQFVLSLRHAS